MFQIDLQAGAERQAAIEIGESRAGAFFGALLPPIAAIALMIGVLWGITRWWDASLERQRADVRALQASVDETRQRLVEISGRRRSLLQAEQAEIYWSDQLRLLSERIPDKIWISGTSVTSSGGAEKQQPVVRELAIEGSVLSSGSEANLDLIGRLVATLQADERFRRAFGDLRLETVTRGGDDGYALNFVLKAPFR